MIFDQLPPAILAFLMAISCAIKHMAIKRLADTQWYQLKMRGQQWWWAIFVLAVSGGAMIFVFFDKFVGLPTALYLALLDWTANVSAAYYARVTRLFELSPQQQSQRLWWIRAAFTVAYVTYIWISLS